MADYKVRNIKEMHLWLEIEISVIHIILDLILFLVVNNIIAKIAFIILMICNFIFGVKRGLMLLEENKKIN